MSPKQEGEKVLRAEHRSQAAQEQHDARSPLAAPVCPAASDWQMLDNRLSPVSYYVFNHSDSDSQAMNFVIIFLLLCSLFVQISTNITAIVLGQLFTLTLGSNIRQRRRAVQFTAVTVPNDAQHDLYNFHDSSARLAPATAFLRRTPSSPPRQPRPSLASSHCSHQQRGKQIVLSK